MPKLVDQLFSNPCVSIGKVAQVMGVSLPTVTWVLRRLREKGLMCLIKQGA